MANKICHRKTNFSGSALILTVVLTSLLAIVGVLFVLVARLDKIATSAISENKELDLAVEAVVAKISQELVLDVPGVAGEEYYDYPDANNSWLASLEPSDNRMWRQISDVTGYLAYRVWSTQNIEITNNAPDLFRAIIEDHKTIALDPDGKLIEQLADADGDGIADSKWIELTDMTSGKGKPIFAAVRIVDNGGMLNVNTAYKFDPCEPLNRIDGSSQMQINLFALSERGATNTIDQLDDARYGDEPHIMDDYIKDVVWRYYAPKGKYTPFDMSDELELRNRFLLEFEHIDTRIEKEVWTSAFTGKDYLHVPVDGTSSNLDDWFYRTQHDIPGPNDIYSYRHLATTYNMDRVINPLGLGFNYGKMANVNRDDVGKLYSAIYAGFYDANFIDQTAIQIAAQTTVNLIDFRDSDNTVTVFSKVGATYYGFEAQPFISEIGFLISGSDPQISSNNYFALELYNPFDVNIPLGDFRLELRLAGVPKYTVNLAGFVAANSRFVITNSLDASTAFGVSANQEDAGLVLATYTQTSFPPNPIDYAAEKYDIYLLRDSNIYLDKEITEDGWFTWKVFGGAQQFYARSDKNWNVVYQGLVSAGKTLGGVNGLPGGRTNYNIPTFTGGFVTVGDIARVLTIGPSTDPCNMIGVRVATEPNEDVIRLDLQKPVFQQIFNYLTVFDPNDHGWPASETRIKGRININTAPWFVLAQLPWITNPALQPDDPNRYKLARSIVAYRDEVKIPKGFESIGELINVAGMDYYAADPTPSGFPDLTPNDDVGNDFEERDVIFARISNLVTVRSDVFTAYILVRIGEDGPQKRMMAILDRSNVYFDPVAGRVIGKVKMRALHPVPDPR